MFRLRPKLNSVGASLYALFLACMSLGRVIDKCSWDGRQRCVAMDWCQTSPKLMPLINKSIVDEISQFKWYKPWFEIC